MHNSSTYVVPVFPYCPVYTVLSVCVTCVILIIILLFWYLFILSVILCTYIVLRRGLLVNDDLTHIYIFQSSYARSDILLYHVLYQPNVLFFSFFCSRSFVSFLFFGYIFFSCRRRFVNNKELLYS